MKESSYNSTLRNKIVAEIGGIVKKISDRSTIGLPDSMHINDGIVTFIECKIANPLSVEVRNEKEIWVYPWRSIHDRRQFETCLRLSKHSLVLYAIYYPTIKYSLVVNVNNLNELKPENIGLSGTAVSDKRFLVPGHGVDVIDRLEKDYRRSMYNALKSEF